MAKGQGTKKKKVKKMVPSGIAHIQATLNNTIITIPIKRKCGDMVERGHPGSRAPEDPLCRSAGRRRRGRRLWNKG
jgi:hypothetical protein